MKTTLLFSVVVWFAVSASPTLAQKGSFVPKPEGRDIVEVLKAHDDFSKLAKAIEAAGIARELEGKGPLTLFAPTNKAFDKLPDDTIVALFAPENNKMLVNLLSFHIVREELPSAEIESTQKKTVYGESLAIRRVDGKVKVGASSTVVKPDIEASNGVIHAIDQVLIPSAL